MLGVKYPVINFWNKEAKKIEFVNQSDFREGWLMDGLSLSKSPLRKSFGIADESEILKRQAMMKFFIDNYEVAESVLNMNLEVANYPREGNSFLNYFNPELDHNPFWGMMEGYLLQMSAKKGIPKDLEIFNNFLVTTKNEIETKEKVMAEEISGKLKKATVLEGVIRFSLQGDYKSTRISSIDAEKGDVWGYKMYSYGQPKTYSIPRWSYRNIYKKTKIHNIVGKCVNSLNERSRRFFYSASVVRSLPGSIEDGIKEFIYSRIREREWHEDIRKATITLSFRLSNNGLKIQLIDVDGLKLTKEDKKIKGIDFIADDFPGYSPKELSEFKEKSLALNKWTVETKKNLYRIWITDFLRKVMPGICDDHVVVETAFTQRIDSEFRWFSAAYLLENNDYYKELKQYRDYFKNQFQVIRQIAFVALTLKKLSVNWGKDLYFPVILPKTDHIVSFEKLEPIHLIGETKGGKLTTHNDLIPINFLPELNGNMFVFTGRNAGGKSAAEEAMVNAIYMAQSGLPVFAEKFSLNIKSKIGMVFLERGQGSTSELLLTKTKSILDSLSSSSGNGIVLVLDEIGTGTQEIDGLDYGKRLLSKLASANCSVVSSTQITALAQYAEKNLGALCFKFDSGHKIEPGIGSGGMRELMKEIGLDEQLPQLN